MVDAGRAGRGGVRVRSAGDDDLTALLGLLAEFRASGDGRDQVLLPATSEDVLRAVYTRMLADPAYQVLVAVDASDTVLGLAILAPDVIGMLFDTSAVYLSHMFVTRTQRRRGIGRALIAAAAGYAEDRGYENVIVGVAPHCREANRFFARLGFAPLVIRRIASVATLRRTLGRALGRGAGVTPRRMARWSP